MIKRAFDLIVSLLVILGALPLWAVVAVFIKLDSKGPIFHRAIRIGKDGKPFTIYKFRTMVANAPHQGPRVTRGDDPRITCVGRFLRKWKIDEMPQLINVLKGEMSIVGPRPEDPCYISHYTDEQRRVFNIRPGMANLAFIKYRHEQEFLAIAGNDLEKAYLTTILPDKLRMDLEYIERQSFLFDLVVLTKAAVSLFTMADHRQLVIGGREWEREMQKGKNRGSRQWTR